MKKTIVFVLAAILVCMLGTTAFAAPFDATTLLPVTVAFDDERVVAGDGVELTADKTLKITLEEAGFVQAGYAVTTDGSFWSTFIGNEENLYNSKYMVLELKNGDQPMIVAPENVAFASSATTAVGISGNAEYPIYLIDKEGNAKTASVEFSLDRYFVNIEANFDGYVVIPNERLTSNLDEDNTTGVGDYMTMRTEQEYRFFWQVGLAVENRGDAEGSIEYVNMFTAADTLDIVADDPTEAPTQEATATQAPTATSTITATKAPDANSGLSTGAIIGIAAGAVVIIAAVVIIIVAQKRKKAE